MRTRLDRAPRRWCRHDLWCAPCVRSFVNQTLRAMKRAMRCDAMRCVVHCRARARTTPSSIVVVSGTIHRHHRYRGRPRQRKYPHPTHILHTHTRGARPRVFNTSITPHITHAHTRSAGRRYPFLTDRRHPSPVTTQGPRGSFVIHTHTLARHTRHTRTHPGTTRAQRGGRGRVVYFIFNTYLTYIYTCITYR